MPKIALITTGGTIASRLDADGRDVVASVTGAALRETLHDPLDGIEITVDEFSNIGSYAIDLPLAFDLAKRIAEHLANPACDGVVVTHGTDTMEESAWMADLLVASDKPVVFTGAQRSADEPDTDGPRNIAEAIRIAASPAARGLGVVIVFEQDFHAARDVTKTHTSRVDTFRSGEHGKLGEVDGDRVLVHRKPLLRKTYAPGRVETDVELIKMVMGASDRAIRFAAASGARAIVLEGFGRGNAPPAVTRAVEELAASGLPVIVTSRCPEGRVKPVYGNGGGKDLERAGAIFAGDLTGIKSRILASVLLGLGLDREAMRTEFEVLGG
ncbi:MULTISPECIES: asparaginase [Kaistia]|uniref:Asparaginase n=1 Tax=Kaistia nematophila TaxID=2994654 RepID=A0A9X3E2Q0_9HYPH|nr:asparaginase [Kaistia nematophila]MBN9024678.1 asparaginase [Hyphomicrobiales bacterium]MCX5570252.1 asparaginase [Kaistia nematophila]